MDRFWGEKQHFARSNDDLPVPHALWNEERLTSPDSHPVLLSFLEVGSKNHLDDTFKEVQQFVLVWVHLPFVAYTRRIH